MADFEKAINIILGLEGEFSNQEFDYGGATNFGISLQFLRAHNLDLTGDGIVDSADILALTRDKAIVLYRQHFWKFDGIVDQGVADKLFNIYVNMSPRSATLVYQKALRGLGLMVKADGVLGSETLDHLNLARPLTLLRELRAQQSVHYCNRILEDKSQASFLLGWMRRAAF